MKNLSQLDSKFKNILTSEVITLLNKARVEIIKSIIKKRTNVNIEYELKEYLKCNPSLGEHYNTLLWHLEHKDVYSIGFHIEKNPQKRTINLAPVWKTPTHILKNKLNKF